MIPDRREYLLCINKGGRVILSLVELFSLTDCSTNSMLMASRIVYSASKEQLMKIEGIMSVAPC